MVNKIDIGLDTIDHIFHIADIHIRNLKRHLEYRLVFDEFCQEVKNRMGPNSIVYIAGDIAHAKTEMSPELVRMISMFFNDLAKLCPVIIIPGNHDANLNNASRLDVLSPIVENINNPRIVYLKDSGIYDIANLRFVHYGIFDDKETWPVIENSDKFVYGLFHGPIHSSKTDIGYEVSNRSITTETFKGCNVVMCGDIHKRQIVESSEDQMVVYAGSMIQQNHGESLDGHGWVEWHLDSNGEVYDCQFHDLHNIYGYYTLNIDDGVVPNVTDMPTHPRLRIRVTNTPVSKLKRALATIRKKYNITEFTVTRMDTLSNLSSGNRESKLNFGDVTDIEYQNSLISEYLNRQFFIDDDTIQKIFEINRSLNSQLTENDIVKNVNWRPITFTFSNMFSYGKDNSITFDGMKGVYGLFAPNASGKSSIFDAISFCIFDKCSRAFKAAHIMNNQKSTFECELKLEIDGILYIINRKATKKKDDTVRVDVEFFREVDGEKESLNGEDRYGTNNIIRQYIGSYEDFVLTTLSLQDKNAIFIDKSQSERKDLLAQFMGIDIFDKLYNIASEEVKDISSEMKKMKQVDYDSKLLEYEEVLKNIKKEYNDLDTSISNLNESKSKLITNKLELVHDLVKINPDILDIEALNNSKSITESKLNKLQIEFDDLIKELKDNKKKLLAKIKQRDVIEHTDIAYRYNSYISKKSTSENLINQINEIGNEIERKSEQLYDYDGLDYNLECAKCLENAEKISSSVIVIKKEIKELTSQMKALLSGSNKLTDELEVLKTIESEWEDYQYILSSVNSLEMSVAKQDASTAQIKIDIQRHKTRLKELNKSIDEYYKLEKQIANNKRLEASIMILDNDIFKLDLDIKKGSDELLRLNGQLASTQTNLDKCNSDLNRLLELENIYNTYEYYMAAIKRDGIPYELIMKALPIVEGEVNNILQQVVDFGMQLEMDGKNINGKLVYETSNWPLEMCSGMERFISGLAIRVALMNICHLPRSNFLVIDEGMGSLDSNNINNLAWLFDYLKGQFDFIMVISHLDVMRDIIDNLIEIKKEDGFSSINY